MSCCVQLDKYLPLDTSALPHLKHLKLTYTDLSEFPATLALALPQLTSLDLSRGDRFTSFPTTVSLITTLVSLDVSHGVFRLKLVDGDFHVLAALPNLRHLNVAQTSNEEYFRHAWSGNDLRVLDSIREEFTELEVVTD